VGVAPARQDYPYPRACVGPLLLGRIAAELSGQEAELPEAEIHSWPGNERYGSFEHRGTGRWVVLRPGGLGSTAALTVANTAVPFPFLHLAALSGDGSMAASATVGFCETWGVEAFTLSSQPGADIVLALLCSLATVLVSQELDAPGSRHSLT